MTSSINNQPVYIDKLTTPQLTDPLTTPSIPPSVGSLGYDATDPTSLYVGDGTNWNKIYTSGSTAPNINNAVITNSKLLNNNSYGNASAVAPGHTIQSAATVQRSALFPDVTGSVIMDTASQTMTNKVVGNSSVLSTTQIGNISSAVNGHTFTSSATTNTRNVTIPDTSGAMLLDSATQSMSNKTIIGLNSTGTTDNMLSSKIQRFYFFGTAVNATPITVLTLNTTINNAFNYKITMQAYVGSGTHAGGSVSRVIVSLISNTASVATVVGSTTTVSQNTAGLNGVTIAPIASGNQILIRFTGVAGDAISYSGYLELDT